jgi:hypothetical protein
LLKLKEIVLLPKDILKLPPLFKKLLKEVSTENLFKNLLPDKSMPLLLVLSMKDMLMMISMPLLMSKLPKLLLFITTTSVMNMLSIKLMIKLKSQE